MNPTILRQIERFAEVRGESGKCGHSAGAFAEPFAC